jgi:hypothetical protein
MPTKELALKSELIPSTSWFKNMRSILPKNIWDVARKETYQKYNYKCGICGDQSQLECHEIWDFNKETGVQTLGGLIALCNLCHQTKHFGFANLLVMQGKLEKDAIPNHFMSINKCSKKAYEKHLKDVTDEYNERSKVTWKINLGEFETYRIK